ncbi:MAG: 50S ribosomal protein L15 [Desulfobacteraceae bacterium]|nr:MAG: 50S ribosomal protein L15 [Desulfobacteraceae bacterium]
MKIQDLSPADGSIKKRKRVGRGPGSGHGKTACRGHKGQKARSGGSVPPGFEGGQMPIQRRLPKRGFTNPFKKQYELVHLEDLNVFEPHTKIDEEFLTRHGLIKNVRDGIKLLGQGEISKPLVLKVNKASKSAILKIEAAGGTIHII